MKTKIENIDQLRAERARLHNQVEISRAKLNQHFVVIKEELEPARQGVKFLRKFLTSPNDGILNMGVNLGVDAIIKNGLLGRTSWLIRLIVPFFIKNFTTNMIANNSTSIVEKMLLWVKDATQDDGNVLKEKKPSHELHINGVNKNINIQDN